MLVFPRYFHRSSGPHLIDHVKSIDVSCMKVFNETYDEYDERITLKCTLEDDKILIVRNVINVEIV